MVFFEITSNIRSSLNLVLESTEHIQISKEDLSNFQKYSCGEEISIPFTVVLKLAEYLQKRQHSDKKNKKNNQGMKFFHELVEGSRVIDPNAKDFTGLTEEQIQKMKHKQKLLEDAANRDYKKMTHSLRQDEKAANSLQAGRELKGANDAMKIALNFIVSAGTMFVVGFWLCSSYGTAGSMLGGSFAAIFILIVETVLFVIRTNNVDSFGEKKKKEEKTKEFSLTLDRPSPKRIIKEEKKYYTDNKSKTE